MKSISTLDFARLASKQWHLENAVGRRQLGRILLFAMLAMLPARAWCDPPKVTSLFPAGAGRGQTVAVTATGEFPNWPVQVWAERPGVKFDAGKEKGTFSVTVLEDAEPGLYCLRFFTSEGVTSLVPFVVGMLKEVQEKEPNDWPDKSELIEGAVTINGRLGKSGDVDSFVLQLRKGQTLVAAVQANSELGSPMDSVMQVCSLVAAPNAATTPSNDEKSRERPQFKEAYVLDHNDDTVGLDPRIVFEAPSDGWYLVRLFAFPAVASSSIAFAGGDNFIYRLTLTTGGFLDHAFPMAVARESSSELKIFGWNIDNQRLLLPTVEKQQGAVEKGIMRTTVPVFRPDLAGSLRLPIVDHANVISGAAKVATAPQEIELPTTITGRIEEPRDRDTFRFMAKKGQKIRAVVESRALGYDLDPFVMITDANGKKIVEADDPADRLQRDPDVVFNVAADGEYRLMIRDTHLHGGFRFVYRLTVTVAKPDFFLVVKDDAFLWDATKPLEIPVTVTRQEDFKAAINISLEGLPEGVTSETVVSEAKGDSAKTVKLVLNNGSSVSPFQGPIRIVGKSQGETQLQHLATFATTLRTDSKTQYWLTKSKGK